MEVKDIICKRVWYSKTLVKIEDDINSYDFQGKKVLLIDDVVGLCVLCIFLSPIGGRSYCSCT